MRIFTVDSFTDEPFKGNPAGVCLLEAPADEDWMQSMAAEMKHSETAFVAAQEPGRSYDLRWFTPTVEVALCGHATLASAHVLFSTGAATGPVEFSTRSGILRVEKRADGLLTMDFPAKVPAPVAPPAGLMEALGVTPVWVGNSEFDYLVEVESEDLVRAAAPDFALLEKVETRGVILTARASRTESGSAESPDYVSRFFAPRVGVPEDPVTGSAHCVLAPYWSAKLGRSALVGAQLSARGGIVRTTLRDDRVELAGRAVTILSGDLHA